MSEQPVRDYTHTISSGQVVSGHVAPENLLLLVDSGGVATADQFVKFDTIYISAGGTVSDSVASGTQFFDSGIAQGITLGYGASLQVQGAGTAEQSVILSGADETVLGLSTGAILDGGQQFVSGRVVSATVSAGGIQLVTDGSAESTLVGAGGQQFINANTLPSSATDTLVEAGGFLAVDNGEANSATIGSGGEAVLSGSGGINNTMIEAGGVLYVTGPVSGNVLAGTQILSGGTVVLIADQNMAGLVVQSGGMVVSAAVELVDLSAVGAGEYVHSAGLTMSGGSVGVDQKQEIFSGGTAYGALISGGEQFVDAGGVASGTTVGANGYALVMNSALAVGTVIDASGRVTLSGGIGSGAIVASGGNQLIEDGGTAYLSLIESGGTETVQGLNSFGVPKTISAVVSGGTQLLETSGVASAATVLAGGQQILRGHTSAVGTVISAGGMLALEGGNANSTTLLAGGSIDIATLAYAAGGSAVLQSDNVLLISEGGHSYRLQLAGNYTSEAFSLAPDSGGNTLVTVSAAGGADLARLGSDAAATDRHLWQVSPPPAAGAARGAVEWLAPAGGMAVPLAAEPGFALPNPDLTRG